MITTEITPNPDSLKFLSERTISATGTEEFQKKDLKMASFMLNCKEAVQVVRVH